MELTVVTALLLSLVPTVALSISSYVLFKFRNIVVATFVLLVGTAVVVYAIVSLVTKSQDLRLKLVSGQVPLLVIWSVVHLVIVGFLAINLVRKVFY